MGHHYGTEHTHDDQHRVGRKRRFYPSGDGLSPIDIDQSQFIQEREADNGNEHDDPAFYLAVGIAEKHDQAGNRNDYGTNLYRYAEQHPQCNGTT